LRGVRPRSPPYGFAPDEAPKLSWRRRKEIIGALHEEVSRSAEPPPALKFLRRGRWAPPDVKTASLAVPAPGKRKRGRPPGPRAVARAAPAAPPQRPSGVIPRRSSDEPAVQRQRQRLRRSRQATGKIWVPTEIDEVMWVEELVAGGFLDRGDEENRRAIGVALGRFLAVVIRVDLAELVAASRRDNS
jgi:hypothetical protein